jgi:hypothetical protein
MPKTKGTSGGRIVAIADEAEYSLILQSKQPTWKIPEDWDKKKRRAFKNKSKKFIVIDNGKLGDWPNGPVLHLLIANGSVNTTKLYVPRWHVEKVLNKFHGAGKIGCHFGRNRLHPLVMLSCHCNLLTDRLPKPILA